MNTPFIYIQTVDAFQQCKDDVTNYSIVGIDTEFERTQTYWPVLCLLQIATPKTVFVIEPQALDWDWLNTFMANTTITKIFHACRQDLEALYTFSGVIPQNIFDTQVAATLVGMGDQISYADLCQNLLHVELCKDFQWSNWASRPLLPEQIYYAANDVRYLIPLYRVFMHQLEEAGRQQLMQDIMCTYGERATYQKEARRYFMNKLHHSALSLAHAYALYQLVEWREQYCQTHNVIRRLVLEDKDLECITHPDIAFSDFLPQHPMRETLYQIMRKAQNDQDIPIFLKAQHIGHPLKAIHTKIKNTLMPLKIPTHYVVTQNMMIDFLLDSSHETNPLFNTWRHQLIEPCVDKLLMIKSKFQAQQNQSKNGHKNIG